MTAQFLGSWRITAMEQWDREYLDLVVPASISFAARGSGEFQFGTVQGSLDCRFEERGGVPRVDFSWEGDGEGDPACGRGWAEVHAGGTLKGRLYFHGGDESGFTARRRRARKGATERQDRKALVYWVARLRGRSGVRVRRHVVRPAR
ncbi:MAG: hypothetical protein AAB113_00160 [Candidatus Eisenbacteria bacterium]